MTEKPAAENEELVQLLKQLLAIELWRAGLSQSEIRKRLGLGMTTISRLLKELRREVITRPEADE